MAFLDEPRGVDLVVEDDQRTAPACIRACSNDGGGKQIGRTIRARSFGAPHRAGDDDWRVAGEEKIKHERGFLNRVGALNHNSAGNIFAEPLIEE